MRTSALVISVMACCCGLAAQAQAAQGVSLASIAARDGYTFRWLSTDRSVSLYQPGLAIVLRPGETMFEVNDHVEFTDAAPRASAADLMVSPSLAARLDRLAMLVKPRYAPIAPLFSGNSSGDLMVEARASASGESIIVNGQAPSNAPVTITLLATISQDVPTIVVSRHDVQPDPKGRFGAQLSIAPDFARSSVLRITATSVAGGSPGSAQVVIGPPNPGLAPTFWDQFPKDPR